MNDRERGAGFSSCRGVLLTSELAIIHPHPHSHQPNIAVARSGVRSYGPESSLTTASALVQTSSGRSFGVESPVRVKFSRARRPSSHR
ncbi:hypothetical protein R1flu_013953 [Riccia fluitans]|uniref:Uncharacterized protein n=1 Tax=Riccia fluitans TaxID=41844 RepID=A0ABD1YEU6_9MARC